MEDTATADSTSGWPPLAEWPTFTEAFLEGDRLEQYLQRKRGVHLYYEGAADNRIRESAGVSRHQIYRLITERCLVQAPDGRICGWRGLIPFQRQRKWVRTKPLTPTVNGKGLSGALSLLLGLHPELKIAFDKRIVRGQRTESLGRKNNQPQDHWTWFLKQCRKLGLEARREWPFNTERRGYIAICRYVKRVLDANPDKAAAAVGGPQLKKQMSSGDGVDRPAFDIFERVEMDGHHLDGRFCVMVPSHTGIWEPRLVHRLWVIVILEIVSRAVLGYYFSLNFELKKEDVLSAIQNALSRWTPRPISFGDHAYKPNAGFPSMLGDDFVGACWDETSVDGALAQKCPTVEKVLNQVVGARIVSPDNSFAVRRSMNDRPFIETFFRTLSERGLHKISNTTGGRPAQRKGTKPEEIAVTSQFQIEYAEELIETLIANYNATSHSGIGHRTPLEYLDFVASRRAKPIRQADPHLVQTLLSVKKLVKVRGGLKVQRRQYVEFFGARYTNDLFGQFDTLAGKKIWVILEDRNDARTVRAQTMEGAELGILRAAPPWHAMPHSLFVRQSIRALDSRRLIDLANTRCGIQTFFDYCGKHKGKLPLHPAYLELLRILGRGGGNIESLAERFGPAANELENAPQPADDEAALPPRHKTAQR